LEKDIKQDLGLNCINIADIQPQLGTPLIETVGGTLEEGLELLSKVGLNDAFLFLRSYEQLSDGQKYRYKIAKMIESKAQFWVMDEFAATLDRDTAKIVAFNLQKLARQQSKAVLAATAHIDLFEDLNPSVHVHKRFGKEITVNYYANKLAAECSLTREMRIEPGYLADWRRLSGFHYRSHNVGATREIFCLRRRGELCGVIVYCYPPSGCSGRRLMLPKMSLQELNEKLCIISRVVIHPKYRTIGLGAKLIRESLPLVGTPYVEMVAVMAKYNPFAEKAGMRKVFEQPISEDAVRMTEVLKQFGFDVQLLGSSRYVRSKLEGLSSEWMVTLKTAFIKNCHPRFRKEFASCRHVPYGKTRDYAVGVENADLEKLTKLVKIVGMLLQTKIYLFWGKPEGAV
jgi:hypothetical protein